MNPNKLNDSFKIPDSIFVIGHTSYQIKCVLYHIQHDRFGYD